MPDVRTAAIAVALVWTWSCGGGEQTVSTTTSVLAEESSSPSPSNSPTQTTSAATAPPTAGPSPSPVATTELVVATGVPSDFEDNPPELTLRSGTEAVVLGPHSYSNNRMAADGTTIPADGPAVVIDQAEVVVEYPLGGWRLIADADSADKGRNRLVVQQLDSTRFSLVPPPTGTYDIWLTMLYGDTGISYDASAGYVFRWVIT